MESANAVKAADLKPSLAAEYSLSIVIIINYKKGEFADATESVVFASAAVKFLLFCSPRSSRRTQRKNINRPAVPGKENR